LLKGGKKLEKAISPKARKQLQRKMLDLFMNEIAQLPRDLQWILADDLVTAFHNRMAVFKKVQSKSIKIHSRPQLQVQFSEENIARIHK